MGSDRKKINPETGFDDILQVRAPALCFYVLKSDKGLYLIDGGFIGGLALLDHALRLRGWHKIPIKGILVTHGHLDHILNVSSLAKRNAAWIAAPRQDRAHYEGRPAYKGASKVTGVLETIGRKIFAYQPFDANQWLEDGSEIPIWDGLRAIHLPGHTMGHMGFYCAARKLLFSADLFASSIFGAQLPPAIFNSHPELIPASIAKALALPLEGVLPNHCDKSPASKHLERLLRLHARL